MVEASINQPADPTLPQVRYAAMSLLAAREHSRAELSQKLGRRYPATLIDAALEQLAAEGLQSDERFAEQFVASRIRRGQGPLRIRQDLRQRGIVDELIGRHLTQDDDFWRELAASVLARKFGVPSRELKARARQMRFLQQRGFSPSQIRPLWS